MPETSVHPHHGGAVVVYPEREANHGGQRAKPVTVVHRWYLGGLASAAAAACTHPLDLLKVCAPRPPALRREVWPSIPQDVVCDVQAFTFFCEISLSELAWETITHVCLS